MHKENRKRHHLLCGMIALTASMALSPCLAESSKSPKPNVILFIADDVSVDDFGCYGHPNIRTPNIDRLAAEGMKFNKAYLVTSQCSPSRCSILSGRYPHNHGAPELHQHFFRIDGARTNRLSTAFDLNMALPQEVSEMRQR